MNFNEQARSEAQVLFEALTGEVAKSAQAELARLVEKLSSAAREEADKLAARARLDAETRAAEELTAALAAAAARAQEELTTALAVAAARAEENQTAALAVAAARAEENQTAALAVAAARAEENQAAALAAAAAQAGENLTAALAAAARRAQEELTAALAASAARAQEDLATALAEAAARAEENQTAALAAAAARADTAREAAAQQLAGAQDEIAALLAESEEQRQSLAEARDQVRAMDIERKKLAAAVDEVRTQLGAERESSLTLLEGMGSALQAIQRATTPNGILDTLLEYIGDHFDQTAVFHVGRSIQGWRTRRFGVTTEFSGGNIPDAVVTFVGRIVADRHWLGIAATADEPLVGLANAPIANAVAIPLFVNGRVLAVVYAEDAKQGSSVRGVGVTVAKILVEQATRRLSRRPAAQTSQYSSPRQARRVKIQSSVDITLDGSASFLVDLSSLGAQVLSPLALRPNRVVQMELVGGSHVVQCKGRVVWALFEQPRGTTSTLYRAGVQFTEVDSDAVDSFLALQGVPREFAESPTNLS